MKKKTAITASALLLLTVGGVTALNIISPSWRENTIFATARVKQLAWLKEHEKQIVAWIHSKYPKVETVQFDWKTLEVGPVSNGVMNIGYNLSVEGKFNDIPETVILVDFRMDGAAKSRERSKTPMNQPASIIKGNTKYNFE